MPTFIEFSGKKFHLYVKPKIGEGVLTLVQSDVHVLLVSLFGIPIVRSISHFLKKTGQKIQESEQKRSETGQIFFWSTKKNEK